MPPARKLCWLHGGHSAVEAQKPCTREDSTKARAAGERPSHHAATSLAPNARMRPYRLCRTSSPFLQDLSLSPVLVVPMPLRNRLAVACSVAASDAPSQRPVSGASSSEVAAGSPLPSASTSLQAMNALRRVMAEPHLQLQRVQAQHARAHTAPLLRSASQRAPAWSASAAKLAGRPATSWRRMRREVTTPAPSSPAWASTLRGSASQISSPQKARWA